MDKMELKGLICYNCDRGWYVSKGPQDVLVADFALRMIEGEVEVTKSRKMAPDQFAVPVKDAVE